MSTVTEETVRQVLSKIVDPDSRRDIVSSGMLSGLAVREGHVTFAVEVDPKRGSEMEPLRKAAEKAVEAMPDVLSVTAVLTAQRPGGGPGGPGAQSKAQSGPGAAPQAVACWPPA